MLVKTRGIVLSYLKYRESSIIARVYTEQLVSICSKTNELSACCQ